MYLCMMDAYQALQHIPQTYFSEDYIIHAHYMINNGIRSVNVRRKKAQARQMLIAMGSVMVTDTRQQCTAKIRKDKSVTTAKTNS